MADQIGIIARIKLDSNIDQLNQQVRDIASRLEGITLKVNLDTNNLEGVIAQINEINARITNNNRNQIDQRIRDYQREAAERIRLHEQAGNLPLPNPTPSPIPGHNPSPIPGTNPSPIAGTHYAGISSADLQRYTSELLGAETVVTRFTTSTNNLGQQMSNATVRIRTGADTFTQYRYRIDEAAQSIRQLSQIQTQLDTSRHSPIGPNNTGTPYVGRNSEDMQRYAREVLGANAIVTNFTSSTNRLGQQVANATVRVSTGANTFTQYRYRINEATQSIRQLSEANMNTTGNNSGFLNNIGTALDKFPVWLISGNIVMGTINSIKEGITYVSEMDAQMVELSKVVELTSSKMNDLRMEAVQLGKDLGKSSVDIMASMAEFGRVTKNPEEIAELAKSASVASNVTNMSAAEAAKSLNTTMIQFKINAKDSMGIIDQWNEINFVSPYTVMYM